MKLVNKKISLLELKQMAKKAKNVYKTNEKQLENIFTTLI
jgi:hypothetical protein